MGRKLSINCQIKIVEILINRNHVTTKILTQSFFSQSFQISTLVQHRNDRSINQSSSSTGGHPSSSERTLRAIGRVGQAVNLAVERFVTVGETIADDNPEIKQDMYEACKEARAAGKCHEMNKFHSQFYVRLKIQTFFLC